MIIIDIAPISGILMVKKCNYYYFLTVFDIS